MILYFILATSANTYQLYSECPVQTQFFDSALYECKDCKENQVQTTDYLSCECAPGFAKSELTRDTPDFDCVSCGSGSPSSDQYLCQDCPGGVDATTLQCACNAASFEVAQEIAETGGYLTQKICLACSSRDFYPGGDAPTECEACPHAQMERPGDDFECTCVSGYSLKGGTCIPDSEISRYSGSLSEDTASDVNYFSRENNDGIGTLSLTDSSTFIYYYIRSAWECEVEVFNQGCQVLGNLCVLQLYNEDATVCSLFKEIGEARATVHPTDSGWREGMPWLYYDRTAESVLESNDILLSVTFDSDRSGYTNKLRFFYASYALDGTYLGTGEFTDQLILCPHSSDDASTYREFGTNMEFKCDFDLSSYFTDSQTVFYEVFLEDDNNVLVEVPVLIKNFRNSLGETPNDGSDESTWRLVRRFYIYDNVSGITGTDAFENGETSSVIVYPVEVKFRVELRTDADQRIYSPLIIINYRAREQEYVANNPTDRIEFVSEYTMDTDTFWETATTVFIVTNVVTGLIWVIRMYIWTRLNPPDFSPGTYTPWICMKGMVTMFGTWAFIHFWYLFVMSGYWFIFYKMQYDVYILIPPTNTYETNYEPFEIVLGLVFCCQMLWVFDIVRIQSGTNLLFLDWEKPRRVPQLGRSLVDAIRRGDDLEELEEEIPVGAWRSIFVANEFNELQSQRYINIEFTIIFILFFMYGIDWNELHTAKPNLSTTDTNSPDNPVLRFFITSFLFLVIGYTQLVIRKLISIWIATPTQNFIDLCAVANISIFILDETLHGYYIHGISPTGKADVGLAELFKSLEAEERGIARNRGILPEDSTGLQTYEIYIPWKMKQTFENFGNDPIQQEVNQYRRIAKNEQASGILVENPSVPTKIDFDHLKLVRNEMNKRFTNYISILIKEAKTNILNKSALQRFFQLPPMDMRYLEGSPFFYRDTSLAFERIFFLGREFSLLLMDILFFVYLDFYTENAFIAALCTYLFSKGLVYVRKTAGAWNFSRKTLIHKDFLI